MSDESNLPDKRSDPVEIPRPTQSQPVQGQHGMMRAASFSGPLPPPDLLGHYEQICPGSADRIIKMAEGEAEHRRGIERDIVSAGVAESVRDSNEAMRGQLCAFAIAVLGIGGSVYTASQGHEITGGIIGLGALGSIVTTFIAGRGERRGEEAKPEAKKPLPRKKNKKG